MSYPSNSTTLTDAAFWDEYWEKVRLPVEAKKSQRPYLDQILSVFDRYLQPGQGRAALEIGGAPGGYLAYVAKTLGYRPVSLDYSELGCAKTAENFELLGIDGEVHRGDLFDDGLEIGNFDLVYSLGLIEHFSDLSSVVDHHLRFLKPDGVLLIGCPSFIGINHLFISRLCPELIETHNLEAMDLRRWRDFEVEFNLQPLFRGYRGGFEPRMLMAGNGPAHTRAPRLDRILRLLDDMVRKPPLRLIRELNARWISGYAMAVYRRPYSGSDQQALVL